jgi:mannosyltransferase OCH1-like enzyme
MGFSSSFGVRQTTAPSRNENHLMIPRIIHQSTTTRTWEEMHLVGRLKKMMPDFQHIMWSAEENLALFEKMFPKYVEQYLSFEHAVMRIDVSRCLYMYTHGGVYCDTDYLFYRPVEPKLLDQKCILGIEEENNRAVGGGYKVGNAFLASEQGFSLWTDFVESIFYRHRRGENRVVFLSGPHALSLFLKCHKEYESLVTFLPPASVYPDRRYLGLTTARTETALGAHLCWGSWREKSFTNRVRNRARRCISAVL